MRKSITAVILSIIIAASFIPGAGSTAFAAGGSFSNSGHVEGLAKISCTGTSVTIGWSAYDYADGYMLYRSATSGGEFKFIKNVKDPAQLSYTDTKNNVPGVGMYYKIRAYVYRTSKTTGSEYRSFCKYSEYIKATPKIEAPAVTITPSTTAVDFSWNKVAGADSYRIYRAETAGGKRTAIKSTTGTSYSYAAAKGKKYFYSVCGYANVNEKNVFGTRSAETEAMTVLKAPASPKIWNSTLGGVKLSWKEVTGADKYLVYKYSSADKKYLFLKSTTQLNFLDKDVKKGSKYYYRVRTSTKVNGKSQYGEFTNIDDYYKVVKQAKTWEGYNEKSGSHKTIIDVFNNYAGRTCPPMTYSAAWCATFVSAVAIKTETTYAIPVHSYCPTQMALFENKTYKKSYVPKGGDVVYYDWNANRVPDHVGLITSGTSTSITAIEGNKDDKVAYRTYKPGYSLLLSYGLPKYKNGLSIRYYPPGTTMKSAGTIDNPVSGKDIRKAEAQMGTAITDMGTVKNIIDYVQDENPAEGMSCDESTFDAFLIYEVCDDADIAASVVTLEDESGNQTSWTEVNINGNLYRVDASNEDKALEKYVPEEIN